MFANTLTLTIATVAKVLLRNNQDNFGSTYEYKSATELITMQIRHSTVQYKGAATYVHNIYVERTIYPTPTEAQKFWSSTITIRDSVGSDPLGGKDLLNAVNTTFSTLLTEFVGGGN